MGTIEAEDTAQLTTGSSEEDIIVPGDSLPSSIELNICKWLRDSEEMISKLMKKGTVTKENMGSIKTEFWVSAATGLHARMVYCLVLSFVVLKLREEDKRF